MSARVIVTGFIGQHPLGGVTWDYVQYVTGLARLGFDVYYFEDSGHWPYALEGGESGEDFGVSDCRANVDYLAKVMERFGLGQRWAFRCAMDGEWSGLSDLEREEVVSSADLLLNISSSVARPEEYRKVPRLIFVDSDPVFTQVKLARGQADFRAVVDAHDMHFSFGECLRAPFVPETGHHWLPTRQPIVLDEWHTERSHRGVFTTVMNWASYNPVSNNGRKYGQKDVEFMRFLELPRLVEPVRLETAARGTGRRVLQDSILHHLEHKGWSVVAPDMVCPDVESYREYIQNSMAEWSVAKNGYVEGRTGWFSCRSACYLAAGRPVVVQDTGFKEVLPTGVGLLAFSTLEEAREGIREVVSDYPRHSHAAREIAEQYFDSAKVLSHLVDRAFAVQEVAK